VHLVGLSHVYFNRAVWVKTSCSLKCYAGCLPTFGKKVFPISSKVNSHGLLTFGDIWTVSPSDRNHVPDDTESPEPKLETRLVKTDARRNKESKGVNSTSAQMIEPATRDSS